jgi:pimeloyl-ACP methyl ester carboxylesterase
LVGRLPVAAVEQLRAVREGEDAVGPRLAAVRCPVLLLVATRHSDARRRDKLAYADALPDVIVEEVDGSHFLHTDAPDVVAGLIARFADPDQAAAAMPSSRRP